MKKKYNKKADGGDLLKWILWIIFFLVVLGGLYFLMKRMGVIS